MVGEGEDHFVFFILAVRVCVGKGGVGSLAVLPCAASGGGGAGVTPSWGVALSGEGVSGAGATLTRRDPGSLVDIMV